MRTAMINSAQADHCVVVIPAYNPTTALITLINEIRATTHFGIVVVDDGSDATAQNIFTVLDQLLITVLRHSHNLGKGVALKTAFAHCLKIGASAVVTADADGQHHVADITNVVRVASAQNFTKFILGVRAFDTNTPLRSKVGNTITRWLFRLRTGAPISDTQTGLRCFSAALTAEFLQLPGDHYEFESYMLLFVTRRAIPFMEVPISTIYIDDNASSHFRPIIDSMRIYWLLFRDIFVGLTSFLIDIVIFSSLLAFNTAIFESTYIARMCSGIFNFFCCKYLVFRSPTSDSIAVEAIKYVLLAATLAVVSAHLVGRIVEMVALKPTSTKILVDGTLYFVSFLIRKYFVFSPSKANLDKNKKRSIN
ncbi:MAG TPA: glycosyltransferase [Spongiibacteraceae bacterium]|jgi:glycosyltransferase involved in cell wall biosynthesis